MNIIDLIMKILTGVALVLLGGFVFFKIFIGMFNALFGEKKK